jgi:hypothetical protein
VSQPTGRQVRDFVVKVKNLYFETSSAILSQICRMILFRILFMTFILQASFAGKAQKLNSGFWLFTLTREGGLPVYTMAGLEQKGLLSVGIH